MPEGFIARAQADIFGVFDVLRTAHEVLVHQDSTDSRVYASQLDWDGDASVTLVRPCMTMLSHWC